MSELLTRFRKLNGIFGKMNTGDFSFDEISHILGESMDSNLYLLSGRGRVLGVHHTASTRSDSTAVFDDGFDDGFEAEGFPDEEKRAMLQVSETKCNMTGKEALPYFPTTLKKLGCDKYHMIIPIYGGGLRLGTLIFNRDHDMFTADDAVLGEHVATIVGIEIERRRNKKVEDKKRKRDTARGALDGLTWSETQALYYIFQALEEGQETVVTSKIADRIKITRSVIINALKKIETAGIVKTRSYGQKGTRVKILNDYFALELEKKHIG